MSIEYWQVPGADWKMRLSGHVERVASDMAQQGEDLIKRWASVYPREDTWVQRSFGVPSLVVRLDCVFKDGKLHVFEVEDKPAGLGASGHINPSFCAHLAHVRRDWPEFSWVGDPSRLTDDALWLGDSTPLSEALRSGKLVLVRCRPEQTQYHPLTPNSVSTIANEGVKECLVQLGLARLPTWHSDPTEPDGGYITPPLDGPVVVKPRQGTRARDIGVYLGGNTYEGPGGVSKGSKITFPRLQRYVRQGTHVFQDLIAPMECAFLGKDFAKWCMIYRCYYLFDTQRGAWNCAGGVWMANSHIIVHGSDETITGPLVFS